VFFAGLDLGEREGAVHRLLQPSGGCVIEACYVLPEVFSDLCKDLRTPRDGDDLLVGRVEQVIA
jgi:hypothetical protein